MPLREETLILRRVQAGDKEALTELWNKITPKLYGYLMNTLREQSLAEDILQETWLKAIRALPGFSPRGAGFSAWLFAIARNECNRYWRDNHAKIISLDDEKENVNVEDKSVSGDDKILLQSVVQKLPEDDQEILRLRYVAVLSFKEIAKILEISAVVARVRVHRALARAGAMAALGALERVTQDPRIGSAGPF